jgi:hypothetical protein
MSTTSTSTPVATVKLLVKEISILSSSLLDSVPKGTKDDKIWPVDEELDDEEFSWDGLLIEDDDDDMYCSE